MQIYFGGEAHTVPERAVIGVIGDTGSGVRELLNVAPAPLICMHYDLDRVDASVRLQSDERFEILRRAGSTVLIASHDAELLRRIADEIWWVDRGAVRMKGDAREVLPAYFLHSAERVREASMKSSPVKPAMRRGDGRAELVAIETLGSAGEPVSVWNSGEQVCVRVVVRYTARVEAPVVGIMIRTRIGMEVYGTNTELEQVRFEPCAAGEVRTITFRFACSLCPQRYTITAASHDPDGVWHDWMEDAVAFTVVDRRYTAGVANLRAQVEVSDSGE